MRIVILTMISLVGTRSFAQPDITYAEYFFDNDPGFGSGFTLSIAQGPMVDITPDLTHGLSPGMHMISVRALDANGFWGFAERRSFFIPSSTTSDPPTADIDAMEYYIDNDPGVGSGVIIMVSTGPTVDIPNEIIAASGLPSGFHTLGIRSKNTDGVWGFEERREFYIPSSTTTDPPVADMIELEYFFDDDPGHGSATSITISTGQLIDINPLIPQTLSAGYHTFHVRAKNTDGTWGLSETRPVYVKPTVGTGSISDITKIEYFVDSPDPGIGNATDLPITPAQVIDLNTVDAPMPPSLIDGQHIITFRAQNGDGVWGIAETSTFDILDDCTQPVADFTPQLACAGEAVQFLDISTDLQLDAQYRWHFDGDGIADDFTIGNTSFIFSNPGTYDIGLAISQGTICYDTIGYQITIKPKPVALFTPQGFEEGSLTTFDVVSSNVDPGATWEWDFENDAVVDDNTTGNTSYTYPSATIYTANLRITDNLGCETSYASNFTIVPAGGGGGGSPSSDFIVSAECAGAPTIFTDLSENIPLGAIYSWDFDDDGLEDDNNTGSTLFTYSSPGDYITNLSIDLGGGNILNTSQAVTVTKVPTVDFSVVPVCAGEVVNFTDLSNNLEAGAVYSWDFENDGVVDNNTVGDNINTYQDPGTYLVTLDVDNGNGCSIKVTKSIIIDPVPVAGFTSSNTCTGADVDFTSTSQNIISGTIIEWDFENDGTIDTTGTSAPSFQFPSAGTYDVSLSLTQPNGCKDIFIETIEIVETPIPQFQVSTACISSNWIFTNLSQNTTGNAVYSWDFDGDGVEDSAEIGNPTYKYSSPGSYLAMLTVDNGSGCIVIYEQAVLVLADPVPDFTIVGGCVGDEIFILDKSMSVNTGAVYKWDFDGDGVEDSQFSGDVSFVFDTPGDYTFNLSIDNGNGCSVSKSQDITLHGIPSPDFEVLSDCFGLPSRFVDKSLEVSDEATYSWDFDGDGIEDDNTKGNTIYTFTEFKPYIGTLTIDNGLGCINVAEVIVDFRDAAAPDFIVGPSCINVETVFTDQSSELETAAIYSWDFNGDGLEDSNVPGSTFYTYTLPGVYQASLTIFNAELCSSTRTVQVEVTLPPEIDLGTDVELCSEGTVTIDAGTGYTSYFWSDGSDQQALTVDNFGEYWVSITDVKGCRNIDTVEVKLKDLPEALFDYTVTYSQVAGIIVDFENTSNDADTWSWDFGDGQTSDEQSPSNTYVDFSFFEDTPYTVCLTAMDRCNLDSQYCEDLLLSPLLIEDLNSELMRVFPNPGTGNFIIEAGDFDPEHLIVVDHKGIIVIKEEINIGTNRMQVDLNQYASGVYLFIVSSEDKQVFRKVILEGK